MSEELNWVDEPELKIDADDESYPISASQIKTYLKCPRQYWFKYISDENPTKANKGYLLLGSAVHCAIEDILDSDKPHKYRSSLARDMKKAYRESEEVEKLKKIDRSMFSDGLGYLDVAARYIESSDQEIIGVEEDITYSLGRPDIQSQVRGIMDIATENEIWDWKTGKIRDDTALEEKIQGAIYMKAYEHKYGHSPDSIKFVYLKEETERKISPSDETWNTMLRHARTLVKGKENKDWTPDPGDLCFFCAYEGYCDAAPVGVGDVDWSKL